MIGVLTMKKHSEPDNGQPEMTPKEEYVVREMLVAREVIAVKQVTGATEVHGKIDPANTRENQPTDPTLPRGSPEVGED
jgi:hypothetical protein